MSTSGTQEGDALRRTLLRKARLNATQDFALTHGKLPDKCATMVRWLQFAMCLTACTLTALHSFVAPPGSGAGLGGRPSPAPDPGRTLVGSLPLLYSIA